MAFNPSGPVDGRWMPGSILKQGLQPPIPVYGNLQRVDSAVQPPLLRCGFWKLKPARNWHESQSTRDVKISTVQLLYVIPSEMKERIKTDPRMGQHLASN